MRTDHTCHTRAARATQRQVRVGGARPRSQLRQTRSASTSSHVACSTTGNIKDNVHRAMHCALILTKISKGVISLKWVLGHGSHFVAVPLDKCDGLAYAVVWNKHFFLRTKRPSSARALARVAKPLLDTFPLICVTVSHTNYWIFHYFLSNWTAQQNSILRPTSSIETP